MAKRSTTTTTTSNYHIVKFTAFWGIIISGIAGLISMTVRLLLAPGWEWLKKATAPLSTVANIMQLVSHLSLFISAFLAAYAYSRGKAKVWRVLFWVFSILAFLSILGFNILTIAFPF